MDGAFGSVEQPLVVESNEDLPVAAASHGGHVPHHEQHYSTRSPWIRAAVLGACDGIVTVGALVTGIASANSSQRQLLLSAVAGMVSGALSMAVGEFVSVSQQADIEKADVAAEEAAQQDGPESRAAEFEELVDIYVQRGLPRHLALEVAQIFTEKDVIRAHARDELGIDIDDWPDPWQAATTSFMYFLCGAAVPTLALLTPDAKIRFWAVIGAVTVALAVFGSVAAKLGGSGMVIGASRLVVGGWLAMLCTAIVGHLFGAEPAA